MYDPRGTIQDLWYDIERLEAKNTNTSFTVLITVTVYHYYLVTNEQMICSRWKQKIHTAKCTVIN